MKPLASYGLCALALVMLGACEEPFSPKGPFLDRTVVFSLLAARSDTQFVRVYRTYYPSHDNPYEVDWETPDTSAQVLISDGTSSISLKDTVLKRGDGSSVHVYVACPFRIKPGATYSLSVVSPGRGNAASSTIIPGEGAVSVLNPDALKDPQVHINEDIWMVLTLSRQAAAYIPRLAVEFEIAFTGVILEAEVPFLLRTPDKDNKNPMYPDIMQTAGIPPTQFIFTYSLRGYAYALRKIRQDFGDVYFRRVNCYLVQTDEVLYKYYNIANGFRDAYSIRMDLPDFSNIEGGLGVFGSFNTDTTSYIIPANIFIPPSL